MLADAILALVAQRPPQNKKEQMSTSTRHAEQNNKNEDNFLQSFRKHTGTHSLGL